MFRALLIFFVMLVAPDGAHSQEPARDTPVPAGGTASIHGRVIDAASGHPLSRVEIRAGGGASPQAAVLTDGDGRYDLDELAAGTYTVTAAKANYLRSSWGESRTEGPGKPITLTDGQKLDDVTIVLTRGGVVTGRILDELGDPVMDVSVTAARYQYIQGSRRLMPSGSDQTNDIGEYRVYGLSPGQYYISATLGNVGGPTTDASLRSGYAPTFYPDAGNVAEAERIPIAPGETVAGVNVTLLPIRTATVSGTATDPEGKPLAGARIAAVPRIGADFMGGTSSPVGTDGTFALNGMTPGDYTLRLNVPTGESAAADVTVSVGDIPDVRLVAARPSTIRGRIVFAESATPADPPKPTAINLGALRDWHIGNLVRSPARIKEDATFEITLPAGNVLLRAALAPAAAGGTTPWRLNRVLVNDDDVGDTGIDVPMNATIEDVVVEMTSRGNDVSGRVTDADGHTTHDCVVIVFAQDPSRWTVQTRYLSVSRPGLDDLFHVRLLAGDYYAVAMSDVEPNAWTDPEFLEQARERAATFSIADGEKKSIDLPLSPAPVF